MTTLRDLLNDFALEIEESVLDQNLPNDKFDFLESAFKNRKEDIDDLVEEYIDAIKERIVG